MSIVVVGSINQDLVVRVARHPLPGETLLGHGHFTAAGGKGANQAVALARLDRQVSMVGRVGDDDFGRALVAGMAAEGVDTSHVATDAAAGTGLAVITLDDAAENSIVVSQGANALVSPADVEAAARPISTASVVLVQLEIPLAAVMRAAELATGLFVLNPAPARVLPPELLARVDVLVPNRSELGLLAGVPEPAGRDEVVAAASALGGIVVVTLGSAGAMAVSDGRVIEVPPPFVEAIDTTGAGDAFCAGIADALDRGDDLERALHWAVQVGALAVTREGAQPSMPRRAEVLAFAASG